MCNTSTYPIWYTSELKSMIEEKKKVHREWKLKHIEADGEKFKDLRRSCLRLSRTCYAEYIDKVENQIRTNSKSFWKYINHIKGIKSLPSSMFLGMTAANTGYEISNLIAKHFRSIYKKDNSQLLIDFLSRKVILSYFHLFRSLMMK